MTLLASPAPLLLAARLRTATFWNLLPGMLIGGVGMALTMTPSAAAAIRAVPVDKAGVGSAVLNAFRQVGGSVGIALMGAIMAARGRRAADRRSAFMDGFEVSLLVAARDRASPGRSSPRCSSGRTSARSAPASAVSGARRVTTAHAADEPPARRRAAAGDRRGAARASSPRAATRRATTADIAREATVSPSRSSTGTSRRSGSSTSPVSTSAWVQLRDQLRGEARERSAEQRAPSCLARTRRWRCAAPKVLVPNLWLQAVTEAGEDPQIQRHLRAHMREVHDYVAGALRRAAGGRPRPGRPRSRRGGLDLHRRRAAARRSPTGSAASSARASSTAITAQRQRWLAVGLADYGSRLVRRSRTSRPWIDPGCGSGVDPGEGWHPLEGDAFRELVTLRPSHASRLRRPLPPCGAPLAAGLASGRCKLVGL